MTSAPTQLDMTPRDLDALYGSFENILKNDDEFKSKDFNSLTDVDIQKIAKKIVLQDVSGSISFIKKPEIKVGFFKNLFTFGFTSKGIKDSTKYTTVIGKVLKCFEKLKPEDINDQKKQNLSKIVNAIISKVEGIKTETIIFSDGQVRVSRKHDESRISKFINRLWKKKESSSGQNVTVLTQQHTPADVVASITTHKKKSSMPSSSLSPEAGPKPEVSVPTVQGKFTSVAEKLGGEKLFSDVNSSQLKTLESVTIPKKGPSRDAFLSAVEEGTWTAPPPVQSKSSFVPEAMVAHLMTHKKDTAINVKYVKGDAITNMEAAMHTFLTPISKVTMTSDYFYNTKNHIHDAATFGNNQGREVILSYAIHPDFERGNGGSDVVFGDLTTAGVEAIQGEELPEGFKILSAKDKEDDKARAAYDLMLRKHMIYNLTKTHSLPAVKDISETDLLSLFDAKNFLNALINDGKSSEEIANAVSGKFVRVPGQGLISLEMLLNTYIHQIANEFSVLEQQCTQGYIYTVNPPSIFAEIFGGDPTFMNRMQILGMKCCSMAHPFENLRAIGFDTFKDPDSLTLLKAALPKINVLDKNTLSDPKSHQYVAPEGLENCALVVHNNSDGFGNNIRNEGDGGSLDGMLGNHSSASASVDPKNEGLFQYIS